MTTNIIINFQIEGLHNFPKAKELFSKVGFLSDKHRHVFYIQCKKHVNHDDRDVEFLVYKREVFTYLFTKYYDEETELCDFGSLSCEAIARELHERFGLSYCSVMEDNENGAEIY